MPSNELNAKQIRFVNEYLIDLNATQAAIRAGYSTKTAEQLGHQLLKKTSVKQTIDAALTARASQTERKALDVLRDIQELAQTAKTNYINDPINTGLLNGALKALELEGKHLGIAEKLDLGGETTLIKRVIVDPAQPSNLSDNELETLLKERGIGIALLNK